MKTNAKSFIFKLSFLMATLLAFNSCQVVNDIKMVEFVFNRHDVIVSKETTGPNVYVFNNTVANNIDAVLQERGFDKSKIVLIRFDEATVTIPEDSTMDFNVFDEATLDVKGLSNATGDVISPLSFNFPKTSGKVIKFKEGYKTDATNLLLTSDKFQYKAVYKTNAASPRTNLDVQMTFTIGFSL